MIVINVESSVDIEQNFSKDQRVSKDVMFIYIHIYIYIYINLCFQFSTISRADKK